MAEIIRMPKLSDTMEEGVVSKWHVKIGDNVSAGDVLADIETDKATMEFESFNEGVLLHIGVNEGATAPVNGILAIIREKGEDVSKLLKEEEKASKDKISKQDAAKPDNQEKQKQAIESTKAPVAKKAIEEPEAASSQLPNSSQPLKASPLAKRLAKEKNINLNLVNGTGDGGRIIKRDIENFTGGSNNISRVESSSNEPVSQMRKTIARRLAESKYSAPHFYLTIKVNMDEIIKSRKLINEISPSKISFNDLVIKASARALQDHPTVNSSWQGDSIQFNKHIHIGVAIAVEDGLVVPVVRFANTKRLSEIATEVKDYAQKAKSKKLAPTDFQGNTFTISNLGMYGIDEFTAIINSPDSCILAVGGIDQVPVVKNGQIVPGNIMKVTLSCDHRSVDGASGAAFLNTFKRLLENPVLLLGEQSI